MVSSSLKYAVAVGIIGVALVAGAYWFGLVSFNDGADINAGNPAESDLPEGKVAVPEEPDTTKYPANASYEEARAISTDVEDSLQNQIREVRVSNNKSWFNRNGPITSHSNVDAYERSQNQPGDLQIREVPPSTFEGYRVSCSQAEQVSVKSTINISTDGEEKVSSSLAADALEQFLSNDEAQSLLLSEDYSVVGSGVYITSSESGSTAEVNAYVVVTVCQPNW
jgi:preprotein translocase subunit SecF